MTPEEEKYQSKVKQLKRDYAQTFGTEAGQRVLDDLKLRGCFEETTFVDGDSHATAKNEGARHVVLTIINIIKLESDILIKRRIIDG